MSAGSLGVRGGVRVHQKVRLEGPPLSSGKSTFVTQERSALMTTQPSARGEAALISDTSQTILLQETKNAVKHLTATPVSRTPL